jgi:hypothetical protein
MSKCHIARDGVYAARLPGAVAAIARDGVYAARLSGTAAAQLLSVVTMHFNDSMSILVLSFGNFLNLILF